MTELKPCPFCGGKAKLSFKDVKYGGTNYRGDKKLKYRFQVICNKCHGRGKPITTDFLVNPNPWNSHYANRNYGNNKYVDGMTEMLAPWAEEAIEAWNRRAEDGKTAV